MSTKQMTAVQQFDAAVRQQMVTNGATRQAAVRSVQRRNPVLFRQALAERNHGKDPATISAVAEGRSSIRPPVCAGKPKPAPTQPTVTAAPSPGVTPLTATVQPTSNASPVAVQTQAVAPGELPPLRLSAEELRYQRLFSAGHGFGPSYGQIW